LPKYHPLPGSNKIPSFFFFLSLLLLLKKGHWSQVHGLRTINKYRGWAAWNYLPVSAQGASNWTVRRPPSNRTVEKISAINGSLTCKSDLYGRFWGSTKVPCVIIKCLLYLADTGRRKFGCCAGSFQGRKLKVSVLCV
jgi:hypothetical protein